ncbi:MAG: hypothetical protein LBU87_06295 [Lactobacillales bacterium]|jgi:hypothetical protein|nr:hypothetical protein [Lactobacillales bacterium]
MLFQRLLVIAFLFCFLAPLWAGAAESFLPETQDIPLMEGLDVDSLETVSFDTPQGQIIVVKVSSAAVTEKQAAAFYDESLVALGFEKTAPDTYKRENDSFKLNVIRRAKPLTLRFDIFLSGQ